MRRLIANAIVRGAKVETGGRPLTSLAFIGHDFDQCSLLLHEEPLGPVLTVAFFDTFEEAIKEANATDFGLASNFFTESVEVQKQVIGSLSTG